MTVALVQTGATGFAVVMLTLGYRLLRQLLNRHPDDTHQALALYQIQIRAVYTFMAVSVLMTLIGIGGQVYQREQQHEVIVGVTPPGLPLDRVRVLHGLETVARDATSGRGRVLVRSRDELAFDITALVLEQRAMNTARALAVVTGSQEGGFDDPH